MSLLSKKSAQKTSSLCEECEMKTYLYQCPRCCRRTCSLRCCRRHKERSQCSGKRDRTTFRPLAHMDDTILQSDYHFLEDVLKTVDGGKRLLKQVGGGTSSTQHNHRRTLTATTSSTNRIQIHPILMSTKQGSDAAVGKDDEDDDDDDDVEPSALTDERSVKRPRKNNNNNTNDSHQQQHGVKWRRIVQQAQDRGVTLMLMPPGMERHKSNTTYYHFKTDTLHWKVEICLHVDVNSSSSRPLTVTAPKVPEGTTLLDIVTAAAESNTILLQEDTRFLLKRMPCPANQPLFVEVDRTSTLRSALSSRTVIEFPTVHVVSTANMHRFPLFIQEVAVVENS